MPGRPGSVMAGARPRTIRTAGNVNAPFHGITEAAMAAAGVMAFGHGEFLPVKVRGAVVLPVVRIP